MKTFSTIEKAINFFELWIEGTYGDGFTLSDFRIDLKSFIKIYLKHENFPVYTLIRETGSDSYASIEECDERAKDFRNKVAVVKFNRTTEGNITIETVKKY